MCVNKHLIDPENIIFWLFFCVDPSRYGRDYYINDSKSASGSRALKSSGDLNRHRTIDDDDVDNGSGNDDGSGKSSPENGYDESHSVSDLDSFYSNRSERQCRYRFAHLPKPMTIRMNGITKMMQSHLNEPKLLKRSNSLCSVRTYGLRKYFNHNVNCIDSSESTLGQQYKRTTQPMSSASEQQHRNGGQTIAQLERDTLLSDIWRSSFSSRRGTRNFVINPLYSEH